MKKTGSVLVVEPPAPASFERLPAAAVALPDGYVVNRPMKTTPEVGRRCQEEAHKWYTAYEADLAARMAKIPEADRLKDLVGEHLADKAKVAIVHDELRLIVRDLLALEPTDAAQRRLTAKATLEIMAERQKQRLDHIFVAKEEFKRAAAEVHRVERLRQVEAHRAEELDASITDERLIVVSSILQLVDRTSLDDQYAADAIAEQLTAALVEPNAAIAPPSERPEGVTAANWDSFQKHHAMMKGDSAAVASVLAQRPKQE
jgi:hypothetical protein